MTKYLLLVQYSGATWLGESGDNFRASRAQPHSQTKTVQSLPEICVSLLGMMLDGTCCKRTSAATGEARL